VSNSPVAALRAVMPLDKEAAQIKVRPRAPWIDADIIAQFATETLGAGEVTADHLNGQWSIECPNGSVAMTKTFGTSHIDAVDLLNAVCNSKAVVVERPKEDIELRGGPLGVSRWICCRYAMVRRSFPGGESCTTARF
jgi:N12 class adenine-specific DNA methylase